ncbi:hypothetical protein ACMT1E_15070 [Sphingomonas flavalba]
MNAAPRLAELARRVGHLSPDWRNPERYFETRSEIERDLRRLARDMERI